MGSSSGLPASQITFDFEYGDGYNSSEIRSLIKSAFEDANAGYFLGCEIGAIWSVDWRSCGYSDEEIEHLSQGSIDCFRIVDGNTIEQIISGALRQAGCILLGVSYDTVYYDAEYVDYICEQYDLSREYVIDSLIYGRYIDEYDREYWLEE